MLIYMVTTSLGFALFFSEVASANSDFGRVRGWWFWELNWNKDIPPRDYHPKQPIEFPHKLHAGDRKIPCEYCHSSARRSTVAGIPPLNTCVGCHKYVSPDKEPIKTVLDSHEKNIPVVWAKVHDMPKYVRFSHKVHINAKDAKGNAVVVCKDCHGKVEEMGTAKVVAPLAMGWCVECHERKQTLADGTLSKHPQAPVTCNTCHY